MDKKNLQLPKVKLFKFLSFFLSITDLLELSERKNKVNEIKNKLESELNFNTSSLNRNNGTKILLANSNFMLFHLNTMKYFTLNMNN